ncbi:MAG TPA: histidine kinase dimerization/phospho-acceptor domain-containing protein, partial [bacterium]
MKKPYNSTFDRDYVCLLNPRPIFLRFFSITIFVFFFFLLTSCQQLSFTDPFEHGPFPYKFQIQKRIDVDSYFFDLDHNGEDEFVQLGNKNFEFSTPSRIQIRDHDYALIEQVNFNGKLKRPFSIDWNEDGIDEILMPYLRNDSLFIRILTWRGKTLKDACILAADNFPDLNRNYTWTGTIKSLLWHDLDRDEKKELILFISEGYARAPRGVFVYDGDTLILRWKFEIGPMIQTESCLIDSDQNGYPKILFPTSAPNNGYEKNGTDDQHSYLFSLDYQGKLSWLKEFGERYSTINLKYVDLDADGRREIIALFTDNGQTELPSRLEIINPTTGNPLLVKQLPLHSAGWAVINIDQNLQKEIVILGNDGNIFAMDHQFQTIRAKKLPIQDGILSTSQDLNGDGYEEILITSSNKLFCIDHKFDIKATRSNNLVNPDNPMLYHQRKAKPFITFVDDEGYALASLERNPYYLIEYYGPIAVLVLSVVIILSFISISLSWHHQSRLHRLLFEKISASCHLPFLILDHRFSISYANTQGLNFLNAEKQKLPIRLSSIPTNDFYPEFVEFIKALNDAEAIHQEKIIQSSDMNDRAFTVIADPIMEFGIQKMHWLVVIKRQEQGIDFSQAQTWIAMAQRIAHEIKNPLTSILLTLQRLQMEYRDQESEHSANYDYYTEKIIERIEALRRTSRQFMKFVNLEKINLQPTNVNQLIEEFLSRSIVIPKDIQLQKKLSADVPTIHL